MPSHAARSPEPPAVPDRRGDAVERAADAPTGRPRASLQGSDRSDQAAAAACAPSASDGGERTPGFNVVTRDRIGGRVLAFHGELDLAATEMASKAIAHADDGSKAICIDLQSLTFIDAAGLRVLLSAHRVLCERLTLRPGHGIVARVFALTGLDTALPFAPVSRSGARARTRRGAGIGH